MIDEEEDGPSADDGRLLDVGDAPRAIPVEDESEDEGILPGEAAPQPLRAILVEEDEEDGFPPSDPNEQPGEQPNDQPGSDIPETDPVTPPRPPRALPVEEDE